MIGLTFCGNMKKMFQNTGFWLQRLWISPVFKQCFVTAGVSLNMAAIGVVMGFSVALLEQLKEPGSAIPIDDEDGSWIASLPGFFTFAGTFFVVPIMGKYGRRAANLVSILLLIVAWIGITVAPGITVLLVARALQGVNMGMSTTMGSLLIGEYTSPRNRGVFLMTISVSIALGVLFAHTMASSMKWRIGALACAIVALIDLVIVFLSPESPSWLASQGRYEECRQVFRWLRGDTDEEELDKMVETCNLDTNLRVADVSESILNKIRKRYIYFNATVMKKEFYKPLIIMGHAYTFAIWNGINFIISYPDDYIYRVSGSVNVPLVTTSLDIQRIITCICASFIIKRIRRRLMLLVTVSMNVIAMIAIAAYSYAKNNYTLPFDHPMIGIILNHCMVFAIATGSSLPYMLAGEIFPLKDKTLAGGIATLIFSIHLFVVIKTVPICFTNFGVHGTFCMYAVVLSYCLVVVWILLPETKDRTLLDIEEEFRRKPLSQVLEPDRDALGLQ